jgi:hypothetical protein
MIDEPNPEPAPSWKTRDVMPTIARFVRSAPSIRVKTGPPLSPGQRFACTGSAAVKRLFFSRGS